MVRRGYPTRQIRTARHLRSDYTGASSHDGDFAQSMSVFPSTLGQIETAVTSHSTNLSNPIFSCSPAFPKYPIRICDALAHNSTSPSTSRRITGSAKSTSSCVTAAMTTACDAYEILIAAGTRNPIRANPTPLGESRRKFFLSFFFACCILP